MTVASAISRISYAGNGSTVLFAVPFYFLENGHLRVVLRSSAGVETTQVITTNYTVSGAGNPAGGSITMVVAPPSGSTLVIVRNVPVTQETDYQANDPFPAESHERALDKLTMIAQQSSDIGNRAIKIPETETNITQVPASATRANKLLGFGGGGDVTISNKTITEIDTAVDTMLSVLAAAPGSSASVTHVPAGSGALPRTVESVLREQISVKDFGAVGDGIADDSAAIRLALDYASSLFRGAEVFFPAGTYYVPSTIFIPKTKAGRRDNLWLTGCGATIKGAGEGSGVIFETGAQTFSTGGSTNWGFPEVHLHYGQIIDGLNFTECHTALKLFNFLEGCRVENCSGYSLVTMIYAERCFYGDFVNNRGGSPISYNNPGSYTDADAVFRFESFVNVQNIDGNSVVTAKTGFYFSGGMSGLMSANNSAEICRKGLIIKSAVYGALFYGWYLEGNDRDISIEDGNYKDGLTIDGFWTTSSTDTVYAESWRSGELGKNNFYYDGSTIDASDNLNSFHIWGPRTVNEQNPTNEYNSNLIPSTWSLNGSVIYHAQETRYNAASGPSVNRYGLPENYLRDKVPFYYRGNPSMEFVLPYCLTDVSSVLGDATIETKINFALLGQGVRFDFTVLDNVTTRRLSGWIQGTTVYRNDGNVQTVVASNNGGFYRLVLSGFSTVSAIQVLGSVRIV